MIKIICLVYLLLLMVGLTTCQNQIDSGLVAYYPFNGDAKDHSGNKNHGVVDGAVLTKNRFGQDNRAFSFDGIKATIEAHVKDMPAINAPQSFSWWFRIDTNPSYTDELGADNMIALVDSGKGIGIQFGFRAPGYKSLGFDTWNWGGGTLLEANQPVLNEWHHCVYTYDGTTHQLYVNGENVSRSSAKTQQDVPTLLMFGNYPAGDQYFDGEMDDIRIYNRNITEDEINYLLNEGK